MPVNMTPFDEQYQQTLVQSDDWSNGLSVHSLWTVVRASAAKGRSNQGRHPTDVQRLMRTAPTEPACAPLTSSVDLHWAAPLNRTKPPTSHNDPTPNSTSSTNSGDPIRPD
jgi:hypothetical protein